MTPKRAQSLRTAMAMSVVVLVASPTMAQLDAHFMITGMPNGMAATVTNESGDETRLSFGQLVPDGRIEVRTGNEIMLFDDVEEIVVLIFGDSVVDLRQTSERADFTLISGRLAVNRFSDWSNEPSVFVSGSPDADGRGIMSSPVGKGWTFLKADESEMQIAFRGEADEQLEVTIQGAAQRVGNGQGLRMLEGRVESEDRASWLESDVMGRSNLGYGVGLATATVQRNSIHGELVKNIIVWDKRSGAEAVREKLEAQTFEPEVRAINFAVTTQVNNASGRGASPAPLAFTGANSVPVVSPAAASLSGGGVVAIQNNQRAASILGLTGSQGLGTSGRRLLTAPPGPRPGG